ncbi:hypothetical protein AB1K54_05910 [Microbacterium sp. BWT-B31]|uniref:hypothetical protein n=1 Tax=Microbacterium sp. BWT-B31 TaxID=3232072 RepID=UPI0035282467
MSADIAARIGARVAVGAIGGLAWAASLRAYMAEINWTATNVDWAGTFVGILLPGVIAGAALGAATTLDGRERRGRIGLRWCAVAVLAFAVFPMLLPGQLWALLTSGLGGGAIGVALGGLAGGYALGGRPTWRRMVCAVLAILVIASTAATVPLIGGRRLAVTTARGWWVMLLVASLLALLMIAASIPFRRLAALRDAATRSEIAVETAKAE